jgi:hypothetical protein
VDAAVQVVRVPKLEQFVERDLKNLLGFWRTVPEFAAEWPEWDDYSREDFRIEWTIDRERLHRAAEAAAAGLLDARQQREWQEIQELIEIYRDTVEWMLDGPI